MASWTNRTSKKPSGPPYDGLFLSRNAERANTVPGTRLGYDPLHAPPEGLGCWPRLGFAMVWQSDWVAVTDGDPGGVQAGDTVLAIGGEPVRVGLQGTWLVGEAVRPTVRRGKRIYLVTHFCREVCDCCIRRRCY